MGQWRNWRFERPRPVLVALLNNEPGLKRAAAIWLLCISAFFGLLLFGVQIVAPGRFGCGFFGEDFVSIYISGKLILEEQSNTIFNSTQRYTAARQFAETNQLGCGLILPAAYWPAFLLPALPFTFLPPKVAYYVWTALSVALFLFAFWRLARSARGSLWLFWFIGLGSYPVTFGLLQGQLTGWQFLALTEFWLVARRLEDRKAGLWLSFQLVKFQFLPLMLLSIASQRRWQALAWFIMGGIFWAGVTLFLIRFEGISAYIRLILTDFAPLDAPIGVDLMMNWRSFALNWFAGFGVPAVGVITIILTTLTVGLVMWSWIRHANGAASFDPRQMMILMAAALLAAYDSAINSAVFLFAPGLLFALELGRVPMLGARFWTVLLDVTLLSPSLFAILGIVFALTQRSLLWVVPAQASVIAMATIVFGGVWISAIQREHQSRFLPPEELPLGQA